jgi:hypothetical protein
LFLYTEGNACTVGGSEQEDEGRIGLSMVLMITTITTMISAVALEDLKIIPSMTMVMGAQVITLWRQSIRSRAACHRGIWR